ncbi:MAG: hypothetical protein JWM86_1938 [Thermoleophilia bacterium]|nr:hypothetical protein [Thermoleophilia bacterium]
MTTTTPVRRRPRITPMRRLGVASSPLLRRFQDSADRASDAADVSDESLARYDHLLAEEAELCAVPADLLRAICWYASGWRQYEPGGRTLATPDGAGSDAGTRWGCMQLSDHWHPDAFPAAMSDARANIRYAANLLHWLHEQTGSWRRASVAFFGHDARAEHAGRRVHRYREERPWAARLASSPGAGIVAEPTPAEPDVDDLYADLAL